MTTLTTFPILWILWPWTEVSRIPLPELTCVCFTLKCAWIPWVLHSFLCLTCHQGRPGDYSIHVPFSADIISLAVSSVLTIRNEGDAKAQTLFSWVICDYSNFCYGRNMLCVPRKAHLSELVPWVTGMEGSAVLRRRSWWESLGHWEHALDGTGSAVSAHLDATACLLTAPAMREPWASTAEGQSLPTHPSAAGTFRPQNYELNKLYLIFTLLPKET